jgi:hypothetical protein
VGAGGAALHHYSAAALHTLPALAPLLPRLDDDLHHAAGLGDDVAGEQQQDRQESDRAQRPKRAPS